MYPDTEITNLDSIITSNQGIKFLEDIKETLTGYNYTLNTHHDDGQFCVDVVVDEADWKVASDQIQKALLEVLATWGGSLNVEKNTCYLGAHFNN